MRGKPAITGQAGLAAALGAALVLAPAHGRGDMWTNAAGHAVQATLLSLDGEKAVLKKADGTRLAMPLASLAPESRQQALDQSGRIPVPEQLHTDFSLCVRTLKRLGELQRAGKLNTNDYTEQRATTLARLEKAFDRFHVPDANRIRLRMLARNH